MNKICKVPALATTSTVLAETRSVEMLWRLRMDGIELVTRFSFLNKICKVSALATRPTVLADTRCIKIVVTKVDVTK